MCSKYEDVVKESITEEEYMQSIAQRIEDRRQELNYSYQDLAQRTGLSKSTLQRYVSGSIRNIPLSKIKILATALEVSPDWLLGWSDKKYLKPVKPISENHRAFLPEWPLLDIFSGSAKADLDISAPHYSIDYADDSDTVHDKVFIDKVVYLLENDEALNELLTIYGSLDKSGRNAVLSTAQTILKLQEDKK